MRGLGLPIPPTKQQPHTIYCIYAPLNAEHEYAYDAGAIVVYLRGMKNRQISHLKITIITPFEPRYSNRPDGAVCYKQKKALDVCIVKGTAATLCRRFAYLSTTKLIRYRNKTKFYSQKMQKYFNSLYSARRSAKIPRISHPPRRVGCGGWGQNLNLFAYIDKMCDICIIFCWVELPHIYYTLILGVASASLLYYGRKETKWHSDCYISLQRTLLDV